jgi:muconolactone delta-isomerase
MAETPAEAVARIELELGQARSARALAASGKQVEDVWRDGRRVRYSTFSLQDYSDHIRQLESELYAAQVAAGMNVQSRRRAIPLCWSN